MGIQNHLMMTLAVAALLLGQSYPRRRPSPNSWLRTMPPMRSCEPSRQIIRTS